MKRYVDGLEVQKFDEINKEIKDWKKLILDSCNSTSQILKKKISFIFFAIGLLTIIIVIIISLCNSFKDTNYDYGKIIIIWFVGISIILIGFFIFLSYKKTLKNKFKEAISILNINPYISWLSKINDNIINDERKDDLYLISSKIKDYDNLKYTISGTKSVGLYKEYELTTGSIFNNPYELSCGVWLSETTIITDGRTRIIKYYDYLPLLKVKTKLFSDNIIQITNSKKFNHFSKRDILLEDDIFNKKFSIKSEDENIARMLLTPVVQNKWKEIKNLPNFNMEIKNGYISILFDSKTKFMDIEALSDLSLKKFRKVELLIWYDIRTFLSILTLLFSISIIQFEDVKE